MPAFRINVLTVVVSYCKSGYICRNMTKNAYNLISIKHTIHKRVNKGKAQEENRLLMLYENEFAHFVL